MELFGILFSFPAALIASLIYATLVQQISSAWPPVGRPLRVGSYFVFTGLAVELVILIILGAVDGRRLLGPAFYVGHLLIFFLGPPALANVLILQRRAPALARPWIACLPCAFFALFLVLLQYGVTEALYGIDGDNGPFSQLKGLPRRRAA
ncbi:MAG: hypothetical protein JWP89_3949 [Schlesneria sp.]|nr:hypothetical protein [Schlesneria sp.]